MRCGCYNHELYNLYNEPVIILTIRLGVLRRIGCIERMNNDESTSKITNASRETISGKAQNKIHGTD